MRRLHVLVVANPDEDADRGEHMLERMGHITVHAFDAIQAVNQIANRMGAYGAFNAVIIDEFPIEAAELIALEIRMKFESIYIGIMDGVTKHRTASAYADEVIPESLIHLKEALECRFPETI